MQMQNKVVTDKTRKVFCGFQLYNTMVVSSSAINLWTEFYFISFLKKTVKRDSQNMKIDRPHICVCPC